MFHLRTTTIQILPWRAQFFASAPPVRHIFYSSLLRSQSQPQSRTFLSFLRRTVPKESNRVHIPNSLKSLPQRSPSSAVNAAESSSSASTYPQRLLIYYAGKRTVYLGTLKLYTVLLFSYCSLVVAPPLWGQDNLDAIAKVGFEGLGVPGWTVPVAVILGSLVPLLFVQYLSPPYVTHIYLHLPAWACVSRYHLMQYLKKIPKDAPLELATIRWFGRPKVTRVKAGDLRLKRERWGCVNTVVPTVRKNGGSFYVDWRRSPAVVSEPEAVGEVGKAVRQWEEERRVLNMHRMK
ncbi:hypothetical protein BDD12DRAFT_89433 [Trichophaea hybrida]|nr:hypothetical protein BDD12DRAFT_89433 [Trichophaea hybrida]